MAKNTSKTTNNRIPVKWVRDKAKAAYDKKEFCYICGTHEDLELHHTHSVTLLLNAWAARKSYDISTDEGICAVRDEFISEHHTQLYDDVYTLCNKHHVALHGVYGKAPALISAVRQKNWVEIQKTKFENGGEPVKVHPSISPFGSFY
jgi:5-methylcytosine-specific restriction endonuclease McrA